MDVVAIIPARYGSSRFPGKPLIDLEGVPMICRVVRRVRKARLVSRVIVATDDERISDAVRKDGGEAVMTPPGLPSGSDRVFFAARDMDCDILANVQGDEPLIDPRQVDQAVRLLLDDSEAEVGTLVRKMTDTTRILNPNTVKVVLDKDGRALYFSRSPIPFFRDAVPGGPQTDHPVYYMHIGLYVYRKSFLARYAQWEQTPLERAERLEQLRILENGASIRTAETAYESICVDTPADAEQVRSMIRSGKEKD
ncbi:3-deoxy-manno-octulosonate cytidylyltransferase [bacterium]|nr:3-deoxy-manno-octulosonate cytidylyltransferase [bacterium]